MSFACSRSILGVVLAAVASQLDPAPAHACSCTGVGGAVSWPLDEAEDVPIDTPIVITRQDIISGDPESVEFSLVDGDGAEIELDIVRQLPQQDGLHCWAEEVVFLRPAESLEPGTAYTIEIQGRPQVTFTTGSETYEPRPLDPSLRYVHVNAQDPSIGCADECDAAQLVVDFGGPTARPVWLAARSQANALGEDRKHFWPEHEEEPDHGQRGFAQQLTVALPTDSRCVEVVVVDVDGELLLEEERCEPDACVIWSDRGMSTCGGPFVTSLDARLITDASCDAPRRIAAQDNGVPVYADEMSTDSSSSSACSSAPATRAPSGFGVLGTVLAVCGVLRARARRRSV